MGITESTRTKKARDMITTFKKLTIVAKRLNRIPVKYKDFTGREFNTFYTTREMLENIVFNLGSDNTIKRDYRTLDNSPLKELGFKSIALYTDILTGESIAILGI